MRCTAVVFSAVGAETGMQLHPRVLCVCVCVCMCVSVCMINGRTLHEAVTHVRLARGVGLALGCCVRDQ